MSTNAAKRASTNRHQRQQGKCESPAKRQLCDTRQQPLAQAEEKDLYYRDAGFDVIRFTRAHVVYEPTVVLVRLAQALALRAPA